MDSLLWPGISFYSKGFPFIVRDVSLNMLRTLILYVCTRTLVLKNTCSRGGKNIIHEEGSSVHAGAHGGHATPQLKAAVKAKAIGKTYENQRGPSVKTTGK